MKRFASYIIGLSSLTAAFTAISFDNTTGIVNPKTDFDVIGVLIADPEHSQEYFRRQAAVRREFLPDGRTMGFKSLNDRIRQRAFVPFLQVADQLDGLCISIAIDRRIDNLLSTPNSLRNHQGSDWLKSPWKSSVFDQLMRVTHFIAGLVASISRPNQNLVWFTDDDAIMPNEEYAQDTGRIFTKLLHLYSSHSYGTIEIGRNSLDEEDCLLEDLGALADLIAGATAESHTDIRRHYGELPTGMAVIAPDVAARTDNILNWFMQTGHPLRRVGCALFLNKNKHLGVTTWHRENPPSPLILRK